VGFQIIQIVYWISLSTWFGSAVFIALAAPVIFKTVRENNPILTDILSVNLEGQHGTLLAGSIVVNLIQRLFRIELFCGGAILICLAIQPFVIDTHTESVAMIITRAVLFLAAVAVVLYDRQLLWPRLKLSRVEYIEHADEPDVANPARDRFDKDQRLSLLLLTVVVALLAGMILFSATIRAMPSYGPATASPT
jgi:hypothetical protein